MKIQIENLRAQMRGVQLNGYQRGLALDEYYKLLDYVEELEQLTAPLLVTSVSNSCSCDVKYVETKKSDIPYDTDDNVYYTDIIIYHCPKCGNIDRIEEY